MPSVSWRLKLPRRLLGRNGDLDGLRCRIGIAGRVDQTIPVRFANFDSLLSSISASGNVQPLPNFLRPTVMFPVLNVPSILAVALSNKNFAGLAELRRVSRRNSTGELSTNKKRQSLLVGELGTLDRERQTTSCLPTLTFPNLTGIATDFFNFSTNRTPVKGQNKSLSGGIEALVSLLGLTTVLTLKSPITRSPRTRAVALLIQKRLLLSA